jgi:hypothetical protein
MKIHANHNPLKLNMAYQLYDYADNLETTVVLQKNKETLIDDTGEAGKKYSRQI